jgi:hypothetical protein
MSCLRPDAAGVRCASCSNRCRSWISCAVVVVLAVVVSILLLHVIVAATQVSSARHRAIDLAEHAATGDADSLGVLAKLPGVTSVTIMLPSGEVFSHSVRATDDAAQDASPESGAGGKSWLRSLGEVLALQAHGAVVARTTERARGCHRDRDARSVRVLGAPPSASSAPWC